MMTLKRCVFVAAVSAASAAAFAAEVSCGSLAVSFDESAKGAVVGLRMPDGPDFAGGGGGEPLFSVRLTREDCYTNSVWLGASSATSFAVEPTEDGGVRLVYGAVGDALEGAVCTIRPDRGRDVLRWRIAVTPKPGWRMDEAHYPRMLLAATIGDDPKSEAVVGGAVKGGIRRNPSAFPPGKAVFFGDQPGGLAAQFAAFYDARRLFYFAAEDALGDVKALAVERRKEGLLFNWRRMGWDAGGSDFGYDYVVGARAGTAARPCDWYDAADLYKSWAVRQRWCAKPLVKRTDLPAWIRDAPVMVRFYRQDFLTPSNIRTWLHGYWCGKFPGVPLVAALWGWEHYGTWCSSYFPCVPSDEGFRAIVADLRSCGAHAFPWPSGYHWTKMYGKRPDGTFAYDGRVRFEAEIARHAAHERNGMPHDRTPGWLEGGHLSGLCPGDPWTFDWWNRDVCLELARRGCEAIQADQICGGGCRPCWARHHAHDPNRGRWQNDTFRRQLLGMLDAIRSVEKDAVVCYEEPNEIFNDLIGLQDYRDCNGPGEWASVFNYIYHEYVPCFQSNVYTRGNRHWYAHMAVDGQIPFFGNPQPADAQESRLAMANGDFEAFDGAVGRFADWEKSRRPHAADAEIRHSGKYALRFETPEDTNAYQIARNVALDPENFRPGRTYRLSAWLRTETRGRLASVDYGLYRPGFRSSAAHGSLAFPGSGEGWVRRESTFTMPNEDDLTLRFMINVGRGLSKVWIDDVKLEEIGEDGVAREKSVSCRGWYDRFMSAWVRMYRGEGRDWLAHGRQVRPPRIRCEMSESEGVDPVRPYAKEKIKVMRPNVHHAAYESLDGRRAIFFANAQRKPQTFEYEAADGSFRELTIAPDEIIRIEEGR